MISSQIPVIFPYNIQNVKIAGSIESRIKGIRKERRRNGKYNNLCVKSCPVNALENTEINQIDCWNYAFGDDKEKKDWRISCHKCRDVCPYNLGSENKIFAREINC